MFKLRALILSSVVIMSIATAFMLTVPSASANMSSDKRFQYAMKTIIKHEGGLSNDKNDKGSWTKFGISLRYLKSAHLCVDGDCKDDANEIIHLTLTEADGIYYRQWYEKYHYDELKNEDILTDIMDFSVNAGACEAHKLAIRAINDIANSKLTANCSLTPKIIEMINLIEPVVFHAALQQQEEDFYYQIVKRNPHLKVFLKGWLSRIQ